MTSTTTSLPKTWRGRLKFAAFALTPVVLLLILSEFLAGLAIHRTSAVTRDPASGRTEYTFHMGRFPWSHVSRTPLNAMGFPDREFDSLPPKGECTHVVFVGDSFTFGDGSDLAESYVSLVRDTWHARADSGRCVRVFNIGQRATSVSQQLRNLRRTWDLLQPDVVLLSLYQNDLADLEFDTLPEPPTGDAPPVAAVASVAAGFVSAPASPAPPRAGATWRPRMPFASASLVRWLTYRFADVLTRANVKVDLLARWSFLADSSRLETAELLKRAYEVRFDSLVTEVRVRGAALGVIAIPSKFDLLAKRAPEVDYFMALAAAHALPALSLYPAFDASRASNPYLAYDGHLNRDGNALVARTLVAWLDGEGSVLLR